MHPTVLFGNHIKVEREREGFILFTKKEKERSLGKEKNLPVPTYI